MLDRIHCFTGLNKSVTKMTCYLDAMRSLACSRNQSLVSRCADYESWSGPTGRRPVARWRRERKGGRAARWGGGPPAHPSLWLPAGSRWCYAALTGPLHGRLGLRSAPPQRDAADAPCPCRTAKMIGRLGALLPNCSQISKGKILFFHNKSMLGCWPRVVSPARKSR